MINPIWQSKNGIAINTMAHPVDQKLLISIATHTKLLLATHLPYHHLWPR